MAASYTRLEDFRINSMNLGVECGNCGHRGVVAGPKIWRWFALHRWNGALDKIGEHMRWRLSALPDELFSYAG